MGNLCSTDLQPGSVERPTPLLHREAKLYQRSVVFTETTYSDMLQQPPTETSSLKEKSPDSGNTIKSSALDNTRKNEDFVQPSEEKIEEKPGICKGGVHMRRKNECLYMQIEELKLALHTYERRIAHLLDFLATVGSAGFNRITETRELEEVKVSRNDKTHLLRNLLEVEKCVKKLAENNTALVTSVTEQATINREVENYSTNLSEKDAEISRLQALVSVLGIEAAAKETERQEESNQLRVLLTQEEEHRLHLQLELQSSQSEVDFLVKKNQQLITECKLCYSESEKSRAEYQHLEAQIGNITEELTESKKSKGALELVLSEKLQNAMRERDLLNDALEDIKQQLYEVNQENARQQEGVASLVSEQESLWSEEMIALTSAFGEEFPFTTTKSASLKAFVKTSILRTRETIQYLSMFQDLPCSISTIYTASKRFKTKHNRGHQRNPSTGSTDLSIIDKLSRIETNLGATNLITSAEHTPYRRTLRHNSEMSPFTSSPVQEKIQRDHERVELLNTIDELKTELADEQERLNDATHMLREISEIKEHLEHKTKVQEEKSKHVESVVNELKVKVDGIGKLRHEEHDVLPSDDEIWQLSEVSSSINVLIQEMHQPNQDLFRPKLREIILSFFYRQLSVHFLRWKSNVGLSPYAQEAVYKDDVLKGWKLALVRNNPILKAISAADSQSEKPMFPFMVLKLANEILLRKAEAEIEEGNKDSLPVFTLEYLTEKYGSRVSAVKMIRQMVPALWAFGENRYTGQLYARLFQVKNPLSDGLVSFLTKANYRIMRLVSSRLEQNREEYHLPAKKAELIDPESGGLIYFSDALSLLYSLPVMKDSDVSKRVIRYLRDETMDKSDYVAFLLMHKMNELKLDSNQFFASLDTASSGVLITDLVNAIKITLNLSVSDKKLKEAFRTLDDGNTGKVTQEAFCRMVSQELYKMNSRNDAFSVDRNYFLYILSYVYDQTVCQHIQIATEVYGYFVSEDLQETFQQSLQAIDSTLSPEQLQELLALATTLDSKNPFSRENFLCVLAAKEMNGLFLQPFGTLYLVLETVLEESPKKRRRAEFMSQAVDKAVLNYHRRIKNYSITSSCKLP